VYVRFWKTERGKALKTFAEKALED